MLLRSTNEFRGLLKSFELWAMQKLRNIQQNDEAAFELAHAGDIARLAFGKKISWRLDFGRCNLQDFRGGVDDEAHQFVVELNNQDAIFLIGMNFCLAEALAQVHHRNDFS